MINTDQIRERLRERLTEPADGDEYQRGYCPNCEATLTVTDIFTGVCTQCRQLLSSLPVNDESVDEHLHEDDDLLPVEIEDYTWDGYSHGDD
jgi:hypothetical protein